ncbi:hypothetical protein V500_03058 [Pseudogymnoascus sp. VKM F-4518 (FW-2643)]|nr:hypothetical protein V500_03058 [Pseudogymnoascus sp. VKM F-4518 (FW-2643)]
MSAPTTPTYHHTDPYKERNVDNTNLSDKVVTLTTFIQTHKYGMLTTRNANSGMLTSRCMALAGTEKNGADLLFHTNTDSGKMSDLASDSHVNVSFMDAEGEWASLSGLVEMLGRDAVKKLYAPELRAWMGDLGDGECNGGPDDPRLGVIKVTVLTATYSVLRAECGRQVEEGVKTGKMPCVVRLGEIGKEEVEEWRRGKSGQTS